ncbi:hypothetical protein CQW23_23451 [Capsicum baccatum]|uniref:FBD domain-containing protein n=1 Tax=Capsicum baccatum TaxID=33114 RepID=A0A2G2VRZ6_CAPBA|nr:hypothetical protein CQW23_23451 [Capsicum baccatum]
MGFGVLRMNLVDVETDFVGLGMDFADGAVELGCGSINRIIHVDIGQNGQPKKPPSLRDQIGLDNLFSIGSIERMWIRTESDEVMDKVLSGSPNLEDMNLENVSGISHLEISSEKLRELCEIRIRKRNVASFVNAMIHVEFESEESYLKELLHSVAHVENHN